MGAHLRCRFSDQHVNLERRTQVSSALRENSGASTLRELVGYIIDWTWIQLTNKPTTKVWGSVSFDSAGNVAGGTFGLLPEISQRQSLHLQDFAFGLQPHAVSSLLPQQVIG
jgi:hypothetical protein